MPGDLHKLWRTRDPKGYHVEYGYSCMGYEIAGGIGVKMAAPDREVYVMVGDGSYLMMAQRARDGGAGEHQAHRGPGPEPRLRLHRRAVQSVGSQRFGTAYRYRNPATGRLDGAPLPVDLAANAESLGVHVMPGRDHRRAPSAPCESARRPAARSSSRSRPTR